MADQLAEQCLLQERSLLVQEQLEEVVGNGQQEDYTLRQRMCEEEAAANALMALQKIGLAGSPEQPPQPETEVDDGEPEILVAPRDLASAKERTSRELKPLEQQRFNEDMRRAAAEKAGSPSCFPCPGNKSKPAGRGVRGTIAPISLGAKDDEILSLEEFLRRKEMQSLNGREEGPMAGFSV